MANMAATVILVVLCMAVQPSMQQILKKPGEIFKLNQESRPYGIIATSSSSEKALNDSGIFKMESSVERNGRRFIMGKISGANVVYVRSANRPQIHVAVTAQIMATHFNILGITLFGSAGGVNNSLNLGDVVIPGSIAFTGIWTWKKQGASSNGQLVFREFNTPENGDNLLGCVTYGPSEWRTQPRAGVGSSPSLAGENLKSSSLSAGVQKKKEQRPAGVHGERKKT